MNELQKFESSIKEIDEERLYENLVDKSHVKVMELLRKIKSGEGIGNVLTGISAIDSVLQGICPGMMDVYAAEAACGKTAMMEMIILKFLFENKHVLIFQRDMPPEAFYFRLACRLAGTSVSQIRNFGQYNIPDVEKTERCCETLMKSALLLFSPSGCTGKDVRDIAAREIKNKDVKLVIVDHIKTLRHSKNTTWEGIEENSGYIRQSTNDTGVSHIVLAHINREGVKSERPTISHIKGGDQLKDDSDNCCAMWLPEGRPEIRSSIKAWKVNFAFDKTRWDFGGVETMMFNGPKMRFENIPPNWKD